MNDQPRLRHIRAAEHALPYRVIFEELLAMHKQRDSFAGETFVSMVNNIFAADKETTAPAAGENTGPADTIEAACKKIFCRISKVEMGYQELAEQIRRRETGDLKKLSSLEKPLLELLHRIPRSALCLSGGGIRSAAFSLGALEALARFRGPGKLARYDDPPPTSTLEQFDYLSTVSGGGYIGSWLIAWTQRICKPLVKPGCEAEKNSPKGELSTEPETEPEKQQTAKPITPGNAFHTVARGLAGDVEHTSGDPAQRPIRHLREYTSYLAPKLGLTLDTWTLLAIVLRNLVVNWIMILPVILVVAAGLQIVHYGVFSLSNLMYRHPSAGWWLAIGALFIVAGTTAALHMPSCPPPDRGSRSDGVLSVLGLFILPLIIASLILVAFWANFGIGWVQAREALLQRFVLAAFLTLAIVPAIRLWRGPNVIKVEHSPWRYLLAGVGAALLTAAALASAVYSVGWGFDIIASPKQTATLKGSLFHLKPDIFHHWIVLPAASAQAKGLGVLDRGAHPAHWFVVLGFPILWLLLIAASALFSGLLGIFEEDVDREWWARAGGLMMAVLAVWIVGIGMVILGPTLTSTITKAIAVAVVSLVTGLTGALGGTGTAGGLGAAAAKNTNISKVGSFLNKHGLILPAFCGVALLIIGAFVAAFESWMARALSGAESTRIHFYIFVSALMLSLLINWVININLFSLHGMYRIRLMRAFLGASNTRRVPNPFTGFDDRDSVYEADICTGPGMPLHLINATVNLVGTHNLAWQQRKAEGFTISPLHCGSWRLGYAKTKKYGRRGGLSLSTAMAISGAAVNPNMGYHSSPLVTLMMTLFNVRLGWWLPNPGYRRGPVQAKLWPPEPAIDGEAEPPAADKDPGSQPLPNRFLQKKAPRLALGPLLREALGDTNDNGAFIELTDGGHFENLGLYEMVLRRVRWIVVIDASADPKCQLEDLGNAMRKVEIDLGIPIVFGHDGFHMQPGANKDNLYCAVAEIFYDVVDPVSRPMRGQLLYIKAGLNGQEPPDITQYARTHTSFPHESTANQFFNEAQFESYRHLGHHAVHTILQTGGAAACTVVESAEKRPLVQAMFAAANHYIYDPKVPAAESKSVPAKAVVAAEAKPSVSSS